MNNAEPASAVSPVFAEALDLRLEDGGWDYAVANRNEIADYFSQQKSRQPSYFNGSMLLMESWELDDGVFRGRFRRTDFASFLHWRDAYESGRLKAPGPMRNLFGMPMVVSSDGHMLVGRMAAHTANAGRIYAPCGSLDMADVAEGRIDADLSMARELAEETGLDTAEARAAPGYSIWFDGLRVAVVRVFAFAQTTHALETRVRAHLARDPEAELDQIRFIGRLADIEVVGVQAYTIELVRHFVEAGIIRS